MATAYSESVTEQTPLDVIRDEIIEVFERILSEVRTRRDELLGQVSEMKREFEAKKISVTDNLDGLEEMRTQVEKMSVKQNFAVKKQQESLADIDSEIEKLRVELTQDSRFQFNCSINQLIEQVKHFGEVIDGSCVKSKYQSIYSKKLTATQIITKYQEFKFGDLNRLYVDCDKQFLYVLNSNPIEITNTNRNKKRFTWYEVSIAVFNANDFTFVHQFGQSGNIASSIATSDEFIYVEYNGLRNYHSSAVRQYRRSDYSIVKSIYADIPSRGLMISTDNQVYVLSYFENVCTFHIYNRVLNYKEDIDLCYEWPESESNATMLAKQRQELFYILFNQQLFVFTQEGKHIRSIFREEGKSTVLQCLTSFCVDEEGNVIVTGYDTEYHTDSIKFFSPGGNLFHTIGEDTVGSDEVKEATDIVVYNDKVVVSCRDRILRIF